MITATLDPASGTVSLSGLRDGQPWRRAVMPHDVADLDAFAPDLPAEQRSAILANWATRPAPQVEE